MNESAPTIADIREAQTRISPFVSNTPLLRSETLSSLVGCKLHLKFENLQFTGSFKERGALNALLSLDAGRRSAGVVTMSAGNHAQGVAYHAHRLGIPATIVMPKATPLIKISRTREHGAHVILEGRNLSEAQAIAERLAVEEGLTLVHPFDDPLVIAGQGTLGLEILTALPAADILVVPIGGGGLISGIAIAAKALKPDIVIIGVQSKANPAMVHALQNTPSTGLDHLTIAEGISVKSPGRLTRQIVRDLVDDILLVEEASIEHAIALLMSIEKTVVEGAGAAGVAAIIEHPQPFSGATVVAPLCGGNIDLRVLSSLAMRELQRNGQIVRFKVSISDQPGGLAAISTLLAEAGANIIDVAHDRLSLSVNPRATMIEFVVEVENQQHGKAVADALSNRGFSATIIQY